MLTKLQKSKICGPYKTQINVVYYQKTANIQVSGMNRYEKLILNTNVLYKFFRTFQKSQLIHEKKDLKLKFQFKL